MSLCRVADDSELGLGNMLSSMDDLVFAFDSEGNARGAMGIDAAHYRNDPGLGVAIGNFATEMTALYVSPSHALFFTDEAIAASQAAGTALGFQVSASAALGAVLAIQTGLAAAFIVLLLRPDLVGRGIAPEDPAPGGPARAAGPVDPR